MGCIKQAYITKVTYFIYYTFCNTFSLLDVMVTLSGIAIYI